MIQMRTRLPIPDIGLKLMVLLLFVFVNVCFSGEAFAQGVSLTGGGTNATSSCKLSTQFENSITPRAVYCIKRAIGIAIEVYYEALKGFMWPIILAMVTLALTIFGVKLMSAQVEDLTRDSMTLLLKIAIVFFLILSWRDFYPATFQIIDDINGLFTNAFTSASGGACASSNDFGPPLKTAVFNDPERDKALTTLVGTPASYAVWFRFDCLIGRFFGAGNPSYYAFSVSIIALIGAAIFSSGFGLMLFFAGITALVAVFFLVARSVFVVLMAYFSLGFASILAPIFIPLLIFKFTTQYFLKWIFLIVNGIIQPVFVIGFLMFALILFNQFLYGSPGNPSFKSLGGLLGITATDTLDVAWKKMKESYVISVPVGSSQVAADKDMQKQKANNASPSDAKQTGNPVVRFFSGQSIDLMGFMRTYGITTGYEKIVEILTSMIAILFLCYIVLKLLYVIPEMATSIAGTVGIGLVRAALPNKLDEIVGSSLQTMQASMTSATQGPNKGGMVKMTGAFGGSGGLIPNVASGAVSGFVRGAVQGAKAGFNNTGAKGNRSKLRRLATGAVQGAMTGVRQGVTEGATRGSKAAANNVKNMVKGGAEGAGAGFKYFLKSIVTNATKGDS